MRAGNVGRDGLHISPSGQHIHFRARESLRVRHIFDVDRSHAGFDVDRLADRAGLQFGVNRDSDIGGNYNLLFGRRKARHSDGDDVGARPKADNGVASLPLVVTVRDFSMRTSLAASTVAPETTAPEAISDNSGDGALRGGRRGQEREDCKCCDQAESKLNPNHLNPLYCEIEFTPLGIGVIIFG